MIVNDTQKVCDVKNKDLDFVMMQVNMLFSLYLAFEKDCFGLTLLFFLLFLQLQRLRDTSGRKMTKMKRPVISKRPSVQGIWQHDIEFPEFKIENRS